MGGKKKNKPLIKDHILYKTRLCTNDPYGFGYCPYKERCQFAHGVVQLRKRIDIEQHGNIQFIKPYCPMVPVTQPISSMEPISNIGKYVTFVDLLVRSLVDKHT